MSQTHRKYQRLEEFFSRVPPATPDAASPATTNEPGIEAAASLVSPADESHADGWQVFFSDVHREHTIGFAFRQGIVTPLEETAPPLPENSLRVPLVLSGKTIGSIQVAGNEASWTAQEIEIVGAVATQLSQHIEQLRPLKAE
jgi:GAF domain-containing protein